MGSSVFWALCAGFLSGVFLRSFFLAGWSAAAWALFLGFAAFLFSRQAEHPARSILIAVALIASALGIARMQLAVLSGDPNLNSAIGKKVTIEATVSEEPDERDTETLVSLGATKLIAATAGAVSSGILATLPPHARLAYGDRVQVSGTLALPEAFDTGLGREFEYPEYLAAQGIEYQLKYATLDRVLGQGGDPIKKFSIGVKEVFVRGLDAALPDPEAALAGGITVGDKRSIGDDLTADFQRDSLIHMVVLSGYNITVVLNALARLLAWAPRPFQFGGSIATVVFFVFMSGGASSATRAGLMALIATLARATHRVYVGERVLAAAVLCMVAWNPWTLCFDPSFQLSALATLGLTLFTPPFASLFVFVPEKFGARDILASTCATQSMVMPFLLYQSGTLSLVSLPANLLALLPVPFAMFFSLIAGIMGTLFGGLASIVAFPAYALLGYIIFVAHTFASIPFAAVSAPSFSAWWLLAGYAALFLAYFIYKKKTAAEAAVS